MEWVKAPHLQIIIHESFVNLKMMMSQCSGDKDMESLNLEKAGIEGQFGLLLRDKNNHNNYILINFEDLGKIINYYDEFKSRGLKDYQIDESKKHYEIKVKRINEKISIIKDEINVLETKRNSLSNRLEKLSAKNSEQENKEIHEIKIMIESIDDNLRDLISQLKVWETKLNEMS
jgi:chromosome segregation ATPase